MEKFAIVERDNRNALHGLFYTRERAQYHLDHNVPVYCQRGYYMDKTLTPDSFVIIERA